MRTIHSVPEDSIKAARAHQLAEREKVKDITGLVIRDDAPILAPHLVVAICKTCLYSAARGTQVDAERAVAMHVGLKHGPRFSVVGGRAS